MTLKKQTCCAILFVERDEINKDNKRFYFYRSDGNLQIPNETITDVEANNWFQRTLNDQGLQEKNLGIDHANSFSFIFQYEENLPVIVFVINVTIEIKKYLGKIRVAWLTQGQVTTHYNKHTALTHRILEEFQKFDPH